MAESERIKLEVVAAPTFSLYSPVHTGAGVVGDSIVFTVEVSAIGSFTSDVVLALTGYPVGASITYDPADATVAPGETLTITIGTAGVDAGIYDMTVQEA